MYLNTIIQSKLYNIYIVLSTKFIYFLYKPTPPDSTKAEPDGVLLLIMFYTATFTDLISFKYLLEEEDDLKEEASYAALVAVARTIISFIIVAVFSFRTVKIVTCCRDSLSFRIVTF